MTDSIKLYNRIDEMFKESQNDFLIVAIDGKCTSGKTTLAKALKEKYDATVFHMDDFFLRPEQRTEERMAEVGGNLDRERVLSEILVPLKEKGKENIRTLTFTPFSCSTKSLGEPVTVKLTKLIIIEGSYSMHPVLRKYYNLKVFLDIDESTQKERIIMRETPEKQEAFFNKWIPLENRYFDGMNIKSQCDLIIKVE